MGEEPSEHHIRPPFRNLVQNYKPFILPAVAAVVYLAWLLFAPKEDLKPTPEPVKTAPSSPSAPARPVSDPPDDPPPDRATVLRAVEATLNGAKAENDPPPALPAPYVQQALRFDVRPVVGKCAESTPDPASLDGTLVLQLSIAGDSDVGAVVERAVVLEDSTVADDGLYTCVVEALENVTLPPPKTTGRTTVTHSFPFQAQETPP